MSGASRKIRERMGEDHPAEAYTAMPGYKREAIKLWITLSMVPAGRVAPYCTSYGLKHDAESALSLYVSNDQFKGAMLALGYSPVDHREPNWRFRIKPRCGREVPAFYAPGNYTGFGIDRGRLPSLDVVIFDVLASWARMRGAFDHREGQAAAGLPYSTAPLATEGDRLVFEIASHADLAGVLVSPRICSTMMKGEAA